MRVALAAAILASCGSPAGGDRAATTSSTDAVAAMAGTTVPIGATGQTASSEPGGAGGPTTTPTATDPAATHPPTTVAPATIEALEPPPSLPATPAEPAGIAAEITEVERAIRNPSTPAADLAELGHRQQMVYRVWSRSPAWDEAVLAAVPADLQPVALANVAAPREAFGMYTKLARNVPAWEIVAPEPAADLLAAYRAAEQSTGVEWEYLAAINLVETGMGRIRGLSSAGAQGPMQFMPETWARWGVGDVNDPGDAIAAAARYLQDRGAPADMDRALWAYNNHNNYVRAVKLYAGVMQADPAAFYGYYHWQIQYYSEAGDLWLRQGYVQPEPVPAADWAAANPAMVAGASPAPELLGG